MSAALLWTFASGWLKALWRFWCGLPTPFKVVLAVALALIIGRWWGIHTERARCEARIAASIQAAKDEDVRIAQGRATVAEQQAREAEARKRAVDEEVRGYVDEVAKRVSDDCVAGADADRFNRGLGVQDDAVPATRTKPAPGGQHRPNAGPMPPGSGKR